MAKQTKPFIVEIKPSRKVKPADRKTSIWGEVDLSSDEAIPVVEQVIADQATHAKAG